jgi:nitrogen regulatory protein PII
MAKYNEKREMTLKDKKDGIKSVITHQGGEGYTQKSEKEFVGLLATGLSNTYYEKETEREKRFREILGIVASKSPLFAAKALIYARTVFGQRSVTHYGAVEMIKYLSGLELGKRFFSKRDRKENRGGIIYRLDDMAEILACYQAKNGVEAPIPNAIRKGFKDAIEHADTYTLAKYQMKSRGVSLVDIVNLVHPIATPRNGTIAITETEYQKAIAGTKFDPTNMKKGKDGKRLYKPEYANIPVRTEKGTIIPALHALILGLLKQFDTVEDKNTDAGKTVAAKVKSGEITKEQATVELNEAKTENYAELIKEKKIGYLALLRNIRNILKTNDTALLDMACEQLVDQNFIKKSLVWPHQIDLCGEVLQSEFRASQLGKVLTALNTAYERSIPNLKELMSERKTAVVYDSSGSMSTPISLGEQKKGIASALDKAALIGATFAKGLNADVYTFANSCNICTFNPTDSINSIKKSILSCAKHGGTSWESIFPELLKNGGYERIIIISDEQSHDNAFRAYKEYCDKYGMPYLYIVNIVGYGPTTNIKENNKTYRLYGYTQDIYMKATTAEINIDQVIEEINKIEI